MKKIMVHKEGLSAWIITREVNGQAVGQEEWYSCWTNAENRIKMLKVADWRYKVEYLGK